MPGSFTTPTISATIAEGGRFDDGFDLLPIRHCVRGYEICFHTAS